MNMKKRMRKVFSLFLAFLMVCSVIGTDITLFAPKVNAEAATVDYGLMDNACDGVILHAWNWSFSAIKDSMADIAAAGYTSVQTSPVQIPKDATAGTDQYGWWKVYQPITLSFPQSGHPWFGSRDDFKAMCDEAEKYGIKVIVDIVANHMANNTGKIGNTQADICSQNDPTYRDDTSCWHLNGSTGIDYNNQHRNGDTSSLTHGFGGWPDLNTGNPKVQNAIISLLKDCVDLGADGFRFDAAKHIELPTDPGGASDFWPNVTSAIRNYASSLGREVYLYGEILDDSATSISNYTQYIAVTDNRAGNEIREGVQGYDIGKASSSHLYYSGEAADNIVLWAESHDTYANDGFTGGSTSASQDQINRTWAIVAARSFAALYYVRPGNRNAVMGTMSSNTAWKNKEVVEVNKFHNYFNGQKEYMSSSGNVAIIERGTTGVVLVNIGGGSQSVNAKMNIMADGTYTDQVTGNTFTVSNGQISGQIGSTGIAVVYNAKKEPTVTVSKGKDGSVTPYSTDSIDVTLTLKNATSGTYKINNGSATTFTSSKTVTLGSNAALGDTTTLTVTATDGKVTNTYTFKYQKTEASNNVAYLKLPSGWSSPNCYVYEVIDGELVKNAEWPGVAMTQVSDGLYKYEVSEEFNTPSVIFNSGSNQVPGAQEDGLVLSGSMIYENGTWKTYTDTTKGTVNVKYVDESGNSIASTITMTGTVGTSYTTSAKTISGYTLKTTPSNATGKYTSGTITVTYIYSENISTEPIVTSSLSTGSTFSTETQTITLTLKNAVSGTYSVDNGPVKTFTSSANVVLGQGKVADSTVTVNATAKGSDGTTKTFTFTYNKKFNGTVNEETKTANALLGTATAGSTLASQYATNKVGVGVEKTISVDGDISDWNSSMLIAQGAANDDPRVYRPNSMYENPVDLYALYGAYDDNNLYLMWEMTNVQDVVAPNDTYPLTQGMLWQTEEFPFFIAVDTGISSTAIGNNAALTTGGTIWDSGMTIKNKFNNLYSINTKGGNGPWMYAGDSTGLNKVEVLNASTSNVKMKFGAGILSSKVMGINHGYGEYNNRVVGDVCNDSAEWVDFNTKGHKSATMDFHYELSIPLSEIGITKSDIQKKGVGVLLVATMGKSPMDCLPYDASMNDNADQADTGSQENNSLEKSDEDFIECSFARIGVGEVPIIDELELNFGADRSSPQSSGTALTLNGIAQGGTAPYTYKYYVNNTLVATKSGSGATSTPWTPSAGSYTIKCVVTDAEGNTVTSAKKYVVEGNTTALKAGIKVNGGTTGVSTTVGSSVTISASATGGTGGYTYKYVVKNLSNGIVYTLKDYSSSTSYKAAITSAGNKQFLVYVKDSSGTIAVSSPVQVSASAEALSASLKVNGSTSAISTTVGNSVTLTAGAAGGAGGYTYKYVVKNLSNGIVYTLKDYSSSTSYKAAITSAGSKEFLVYVKDSTGKEVVSNSVQVTATKALSASLKVNGSTSTVSTSVGSNVTLTASATGGSGSYTYKYVVKNLTNGMTVTLKQYSSSTSYKAAITSTGNKQFMVYVKDSTGKEVVSNVVNVTAGAAALSASLKVNDTTSAVKATVGSSVKLAVSAKGGNGSYSYKYVVTNLDNGMTVTLKGYGADSSYTVPITSAGNKEFKVYVKDATGKEVVSNVVKVTAVKGFGASLKGNGDTSDITAKVGDSVVLKATAAGGNGSYTYKYIVINHETGMVVTLKNYTTSATYTAKLTSAGKKEFFVYVKDASGNIVSTNTIMVTAK